MPRPPPAKIETLDWPEHWNTEDKPPQLRCLVDGCEKKFRFRLYTQGMKDHMTAVPDPWDDHACSLYYSHAVAGCLLEQTDCPYPGCNVSMAGLESSDRLKKLFEHEKEDHQGNDNMSTVSGFVYLSRRKQLRGPCALKAQKFVAFRLVEEVQKSPYFHHMKKVFKARRGKQVPWPGLPRYDEQRWKEVHDVISPTAPINVVTGGLLPSGTDSEYSNPARQEDILGNFDAVQPLEVDIPSDYDAVLNQLRDDYGAGKI